MIVSILLVDLIGPLHPQPAHAQSTSDNEILAQARTHYLRSRFQAAIDILAPLAEKAETPIPSRIEALQLLALCHGKLGRRSQAVTTYDRLLDLDPKWRPDPNTTPPDQSAIFDDALKYHVVRVVEPEPPGPEAVVAPPPVNTGITPTEKPPVEHESRGRKRYWVWGAVAVIAGGILYLVLKKPDEAERLPDPPPPPPDGAPRWALP